MQAGIEPQTWLSPSLHCSLPHCLMLGRHSSLPLQSPDQHWAVYSCTQHSASIQIFYAAIRSSCFIKKMIASKLKCLSCMQPSSSTQISLELLKTSPVAHIFSSPQNLPSTDFRKSRRAEHGPIKTQILWNSVGLTCTLLGGDSLGEAWNDSEAMPTWGQVLRGPPNGQEGFGREEWRLSL